MITFAYQKVSIQIYLRSTSANRIFTERGWSHNSFNHYIVSEYQIEPSDQSNCS